MERQAAEARWQQLHETEQWHNGSWTSWAKERSASHPYHRDHGLVVGVAETDLRPDDKFLATKLCGPPPSPSEQADEDQDDPSNPQYQHDQA